MIQGDSVGAPGRACPTIIYTLSRKEADNFGRVLKVCHVTFASWQLLKGPLLKKQTLLYINYCTLLLFTGSGRMRNSYCTDVMLGFSRDAAMRVVSAPDFEAEKACHALPASWRTATGLDLFSRSVLQSKTQHGKDDAIRHWVLEACCMPAGNTSCGSEGACGHHILLHTSLRPQSKYHAYIPEAADFSGLKKVFHK